MTQSSPHRHAVVIGGSLAGLLAAAVLAEHATVTIIEADTLPEGPEPRRGLPQARHTHLLWSGGARAVEEILPGITDDWQAAGAVRRSLPTGLVGKTARGWLPRHGEMQFSISCSRDLLDSVIRSRVIELAGVTTLQQSRVRALEGGADRITGVRVDTPGEENRLVTADLVVDASGRGSRARTWLEALGVSGLEEAGVDSGLVCATRVFEAPEGAHAMGFPIIDVRSDPRMRVPGRTATIVPIENGRWQATLSGTHGGRPTSDPEAFLSFAKGVRDPIVGELLEGRRPLTGVSVTRGTANRRIFFENAELPDGFFAVGDSVATFNPLYGQGMTVAAQGILAVRTLLRAKGLAHPSIGIGAQRAIAPRVAAAWDLATSQDIKYPGATGMQPRAGAGLRGAYVDRLMTGATTTKSLTAALLQVVTMNRAPAYWLRPAVVREVLRASGRGALKAAPLTAAERAVAGLDLDGPAAPPVPAPAAGTARTARTVGTGTAGPAGPVGRAR
ncbi:NAD(P)/FAD-dependent oxidoreductase [Streptomyces sp. NBC_00503]|uniref:NAD(P)/FAD-dependent oxidoreductase n=1 Tax=Streptomyces sp. NBC_00503 TaxID=2903659 RepID=UPI002E80EF41|nr:FAD-dependent oxidoreductase [Streptomyces sp. NBC_00503]WUD84534.1 FAD-dependent oxidoreductase [Streptomyces sp. NBC_00503]